MTVYVESNFVLEQSLQQEECNARGDLGTKETRATLSNDLRGQLSELARSKPNRAVAATFESLVAVLIASAQFERAGLRRTISELLRTAHIIALEAAILMRAADLELDYGMSGCYCPGIRPRAARGSPSSRELLPQLQFEGL